MRTRYFHPAGRYLILRATANTGWPADWMTEEIQRWQEEEICVGLTGPENVTVYVVML